MNRLAEGLKGLIVPRDEKKRRVIYRSAITGRFVSKAYAEANPDTTVRQVR